MKRVPCEDASMQKKKSDAAESLQKLKALGGTIGTVVLKIQCLCDRPSVLLTKLALFFSKSNVT